jgi:hypothetical protein
MACADFLKQNGFECAARNGIGSVATGETAAGRVEARGVLQT